MPNVIISDDLESSIEMRVYPAAPIVVTGIENRLVLGGGLIGVINGVNATYTTEHPFFPESVSVSRNGLRLRRVDEFNTTGSQTVTFSISPEVGELLSVDYIRSDI